jgi:hypothetical protein
MLTATGIDHLEHVRAEQDRHRGGNGVGRTDDPWPLMQRLHDDALPSVPTLPAELLPEGLRPWLVDAAERMRCHLS